MDSLMLRLMFWKGCHGKFDVVVDVVEKVS